MSKEKEEVKLVQVEPGGQDTGMTSEDASVMTAEESSPEHAGLERGIGDEGETRKQVAVSGEEGKSTGPSEKEKLAQRLREAGFDGEDGDEPPARQEKKEPEKIEGEIPEDSVGIPEDFSDRQRRAFIQERINNRKKVSELEKQLSQKEPPKQDIPKTSESVKERDHGPRSGADVAFLFSQRDRAQKVLDGFPDEKMNQEQARQVLSSAELLINGLDDVDSAIEAIEEAAARGDRDLVAQIRNELPIIRVREERAQRHRDDESRQFEARKAEFDKEIGTAMDSYPELKEKNPETMKFANDWMKENVGKPDNQGPYYVTFYSDPKRAARIIHSMMDSYQAKRTQAYQDEIKLLRQKLNGGAGPMDGGGAPPVEGKALSEKQKTGNELQRRGISLE